LLSAIFRKTAMPVTGKPDFSTSFILIVNHKHVLIVCLSRNVKREKYRQTDPGVSKSVLNRRFLGLDHSMGHRVGSVFGKQVNPRSAPDHFADGNTVIPDLIRNPVSQWFTLPPRVVAEYMIKPGFWNFESLALGPPHILRGHNLRFLCPHPGPLPGGAGDAGHRDLLARAVGPKIPRSACITLKRCRLPLLLRV